MSISAIGKHMDQKNGNYGNIWICNDNKKQNMLINRNSSIPNGWRTGRKMIYETIKSIN